MAFILEYSEHMIRRWMEDPKERDEKSRQHLYEMRDRCEKLKATWAQPVKPYGFWTTEAHHQKYYADLKESGMLGRRDGYEAVEKSLR
ncbi:hypothetical protein KFL_003640110 [Klebsormidium nitens]|uniref:Uncharacterized protein n=1 Tax=Klebsormidium nitens TaxID=105231 RepID=A0A1Y1IDU9_KLENI|nr:hypothetical protein KFL_003640110 [Klebsormidium nitens]|eukprot:GAQ87609.1 hypothetical protein KFL_003640110 [Klebsormidium nitens]